jgi:hypothetical protein
MRSSEFITEAEIPVHDKPGFQHLAQLLKTQCGDYLKIFKETGKVLYRGTDPGALAFSGRSRDDRKPLGSDPTAHRLVNIALTKLGIDARRDNSVFTTSDQNTAGEFGVIYIIIPGNSAVYSWSNDRDITLSPATVRLHSYSRDWRLLRRAAIEGQEIERQANGLYTAHQESQREDKTGLDVLRDNRDSARKLLTIARGMHLTGGNDINQQMSDPITAKPLLDWVVENWPDTVLGAYIAREMDRSLTLPVEINPQKLQATYQFTDENLEAALVNGHEVLIHGNYIAVRPGVWNELTAQDLV